jgi:5-hydroxyisourate hydrolase-like protein (transthyretin family)
MSEYNFAIQDKINWTAGDLNHQRNDSLYILVNLKKVGGERLKVVQEQCTNTEGRMESDLCIVIDA